MNRDPLHSRGMDPEALILHTSRSRLGWLIDALLTALAWLGFGYLFVTGLHAVLQEASGPDVPGVGPLLPTMGTLTVYLVVAAINAAVLLAWAVYNQYRFRGRDRRKPIPPVHDHELALSFGIDASGLHTLRQARIAVVEHQPDGAIAQVAQLAPC